VKCPRLPVRAALFAALLSVLLGACDKTPVPPPPAPVQAAPKVATPAAPAVNEAMKRLAAEVYVYAFPLIVTDATRQAQTAHTPLNVFQHRRSLADAAAATASYPNADVLYSQAWLDLSKEPVVLSIPDMRNHYYLIAMLDAWTNVAGSFGKRTLGAEKGDLAIVGPRWKGTLPAGVSEVKSPTELAWLFGRLRPADRNDLASALKIQDQIKLTPLSHFGKRGDKTAPSAAPAPGDAKGSPRDQVTAMDAATFFTRVAMLLPANPPAKEDAPMVEKMKRLGIVAGQPFDVTKLDPLDATSVTEGAKSARDQIVKAGQAGGSADVRNGWEIDRDLGRWGVDYGKRAVAAWRGIGVNAPEDAIFMRAVFDGGGHRLDGANRYVLHFDKATAPPTEGFWSVSIYDEAQHFVANPLNRHNLASGDDLRTNPDGSIDLYIQAADPGKDRESNWLPAPKGPFTVMLRVYWPKQEVVDGRWNPPGIRAAT
jgi:hypothetical protein